MKNPIEAALRPIVRQYGLGSVLESLGKIADAQRESSVQVGADKGEKSKKRSVKATAPEYVSKLELSSEKIEPVVDLAERFECMKVKYTKKKSKIKTYSWNYI